MRLRPVSAISTVERIDPEMLSRISFTRAVAWID